MGLVRLAIPSAAFPTGGRARPGFTLIEVIVTLGVLMVILGLLLPALGVARERSKMTRMALAAKSNMLAVSAYAGDYGDVYPIAAPTVGSAMLFWRRPVLDGEYLPHEAAVDPDAMQEFGGPRFAMSGALLHPARQMEPGATLPIELAGTAPVRQSQVAHPSQKGALVRYVFLRGAEHVPWTWNPFDRPRAPVAWADGSVSERRCTDFDMPYDFFENWVGHPVISTWSGCQGLDRLAITP